MLLVILLLLLLLLLVFRFRVYAETKSFKYPKEALAPTVGGKP